MTTVVVLAKEPRPGRVKTRLIPALTPVAAASVAAAALRDTLGVAERCAASGRLLAFDGDARGWLRPGWSLVSQPQGGLDARIAAALRAAGPGPAVLIGMDTPQLRPEQLDEFDPDTYDACLGPATDGGFWAIGFARPRTAAQTVLGVPMSTPATGDEQLRRLRELGLTVQLLDRLTDVDTLDTAVEVARLAPCSAFAAALADADEAVG